MKLKRLLLQLLTGIVSNLIGSLSILNVLYNGDLHSIILKTGLSILSILLYLIGFLSIFYIIDNQFDLKLKKDKKLIRRFTSIGIPILFIVASILPFKFIITNYNKYELFYKIERNDLSAVVKLVKNNADVNFIYSNPDEPISWNLNENDTTYLINTYNQRFLISPLHYSIELDENEIAKCLLEKANPNLTDSFSHITPLMWAAYTENLEICKILISKGASINAKDRHGFTALHYAVYSDNYQIAKFLIDNSASIDEITDNGWTPLHIAIRRNNTQIAKLLASKGTNLNKALKYNYLSYVLKYERLTIADILIRMGISLNINDSVSLNLFHLALNDGNKNLVEILIAKGIDVNKPFLNETPLHFILRKGSRYKFIETLLNAGADINSKNSSGKDVIQVAIEKKDINMIIGLSLFRLKGNYVRSESISQIYQYVKNPDITNYNKLIRYNDPNLNVIANEIAIWCNSLDIILHLIENRNSLNYLMETAIINDNDWLVNLLSKPGTGIGLVDSSANFLIAIEKSFNILKRSWLSKAIDNNSSKAVSVLLKNRANPNELEMFGPFTNKSMLVKAIDNDYKNKYRIVDLLIKNGADVNLGCNSSYTYKMDINSTPVKRREDITLTDSYSPLYYAISKNEFDIVKLLVSHGANLNNCYNGISALNYAIECNNYDLTSWFVNLFPNLAEKTKDDLTSLHYAIKAGNLRIIKFLKRKGVDFSINRGKAFDYAKEKGDKEIEIFLERWSYQ